MPPTSVSAINQINSNLGLRPPFFCLQKGSLCFALLVLRVGLLCSFVLVLMDSCGLYHGLTDPQICLRAYLGLVSLRQLCDNSSRWRARDGAKEFFSLEVIVFVGSLIGCLLPVLVSYCCRCVGALYCLALQGTFGSCMPIWLVGPCQPHLLDLGCRWLAICRFQFAQSAGYVCSTLCCSTARFLM